MTTPEQPEQTPPGSANTDVYAVFAEAEGHDRPLLQLDMTFARLLDDIVVPYQSNESFFVDGAPVTAAKLRRIKILRMEESFAVGRMKFNSSLTLSSHEVRKLHGEQYTTRFEHLLRQHSEDVTAQVIKAFNQVIKPSLKDYLPRREELISAALKMFVEGVKALSN